MQMPEEMALRAARLVNEAEDMRKAGADALKDIYADLREQLKALDINGKEITQEIARFKGAVAIIRASEEDLRKAEEKEEGVAEFVAVLKSGLTRARAREENDERAVAGSLDPKLAATIANAMQTDIGRKVLVTAIDIMIEREEAEETHVHDLDHAETSASGGVTEDASGARPDEAPQTILPETAQESTAARMDVPGTLPVIENHPRTSVQGDGYPHKDSERPLDTEEGSLQSQVAGAPTGTQAPSVDTNSPAPEQPQQLRSADQIATDMGLPPEPDGRCQKPKVCGRFSHVKLCLGCRVAAGLETAAIGVEA